MKDKNKQTDLGETIKNAAKTVILQTEAEEAEKTAAKKKAEEFKKASIVSVISMHFGAHPACLNLMETGAIDNKFSGATQNKVAEDYSYFTFKAMSAMREMRLEALKKYGPMNHMNIEWYENLERGARHIMSFAGLRSDEGGTDETEMCHVFCRVMMAIEAAISETNGGESLFDDFHAVDDFYELKTLTPSLSLYPMALRRIMQDVPVIVSEIHTWMEITDKPPVTYSAPIILTKKQTLELLDQIFSMILDVISDNQITNDCILKMVNIGSMCLICLNSISAGYGEKTTDDVTMVK